MTWQQALGHRASQVSLNPIPKWCIFCILAGETGFRRGGACPHPLTQGNTGGGKPHPYEEDGVFSLFFPARMQSQKFLLAFTFSTSLLAWSFCRCGIHCRANPNCLNIHKLVNTKRREFASVATVLDATKG